MDAYIAKMNGKPLTKGNVIEDFRGDTHIFEYITSRKKVLTLSGKLRTEFNPSVFPGLTIEVEI